MKEKRIYQLELSSDQLTRELFGKFDENIKTIEEAFDAELRLKDSQIEITADDSNATLIEILLGNLSEIIKRQKRLDRADLEYSIKLLKSGNTDSLVDLLSETLVYTSMGKPIRAKTLGQKRYLDEMKSKDIVFGIGPAGTGKTYLAMAMAVKAFKNKEVNRIILTRPAVEAGENLGFLPGDLQMKVDPYLRPLYDALFEILGHEQYNKYVEKGLIEVAPLAYMRGRTLDSAYIILDEAQNTTNEQMKMFLTRMGYGSKAVITGDITQIDLPRGKQSGLKKVLKILKNVKGIGITYLGKNDIVRHPLIQRIIEAYDKYDEENRDVNKEKSR